MDAKTPSPRSRTRSSAARSKAGSTRAGTSPSAAGAPRATRAPTPRTSALLRDPLALIDRAAAGEFPATLYLEGPCEPLKAALLAELRHAWAEGCPESPRARVLRAAEDGIEAILSAWQGSSLFSPRELVLVLDLEDLGRSEKRIAALAAGLAQPAGGTSLVLVESAADSPRKSLEPLRAVSAVRWTAFPPGRPELLAWGARILARRGIEAEPGVTDALADACEGDALAFFNELGKLASCAGPGGRVTPADVAALLRPVVGADLPDYLGAVALGHPGLAAQRLGRLLAAGVGEGTVLFALSNLVGGALGGWARWRDLSEALRRRRSPQELSAAVDALYRAEAAWKGGRADVVAVIEQATRAVCGAA